ncbi:MAG: hypothetical protein ACOC5B_01860, partial [Myxococcota bacterium]
GEGSAGPGAGFGGSAAGPPAGAPPSAPAQPGGAAMSASNKKVLLWVAIGCAGLLMLACVVGIIAFVLIGKEAKNEATSFAADASRVSLGFALSGIQMTCQNAGPEGAADFFHPETFAQLEDRACSVDDAVIDVFADAEKSDAFVLAQTDHADMASSLGLDPDSCFLYEAGDARIIGCSVEDGFKIIDLRDLGAI